MAPGKVNPLSFAQEIPQTTRDSSTNEEQRKEAMR
jgi:hypothetical protein